MKLNTLLLLSTIVGAVFGLALLIAPDVLLGSNGITTDANGLTLARLLGAEFAGFTLVTWMARQDKSARRLVVVGHLMAETLGFIVSLFAKLAGVGNSMFWSNVIIYLFFALGYAYFQFIKPETD